MKRWGSGYKTRPRPAKPDPAAAEKQLAEDLLKAINDGSGSARALVVTLLILAVYIVIVVSGTDDEQLLRNSTVAVPTLSNATVPASAFYAVMPWVFLFIHLDLLIHLSLLSEKLHRFNEAVESLNAPDTAGDLRLRLAGFPFSNWLGRDPHSGATLCRLQGVTVWSSLVLIPLLALLALQLGFLAYHSEFITWGHRLALLLDVAMLFYFWPRMIKGRWLPGRRTPTTARTGWRKLVQPLSPFWMSALTLLALPLLFVSLLVATIPDEEMDRWARWGMGSVGSAKDCQEIRPEMARELCTTLNLPDDLHAAVPTVALFHLDGSWFHRSLTVRDRVLAKTEPRPEVIVKVRSTLRDMREGKKTVIAGQELDPMRVYEDAIFEVRGLDLRERDLRYSDFSDSSFPNASFEKAVLDHASLWRVDLRKASLFRSQLAHTLLIDANLTGADLTGSTLIDSDLRGITLTGAELTESDLSNTDLSGANLTATKLSWANLTDANISRATLTGTLLMEATLTGADLSGATLSKSNLRKATLARANFQQTTISDTDLSLTKLSGSDLSGATLINVDLSIALLTQANLSGATLAGVNLSEAILTAADFDNASLLGVDLSESTLTCANLTRGDFTGSNFNAAMLAGANLNRTMLTGAQMKGANQTGVIWGRRPIVGVIDEKTLRSKMDGLRKANAPKPFHSATQAKLTKLIGTSTQGLVTSGCLERGCPNDADRLQRLAAEHTEVFKPLACPIKSKPEPDLSAWAIWRLRNYSDGLNDPSFGMYFFQKDAPIATQQALAVAARQALHDLARGPCAATLAQSIPEDIRRQAQHPAKP